MHARRPTHAIRTTLAAALLALPIATRAQSQPCGTSLDRVRTTGLVAASGLATALEYDDGAPVRSWHVASEPDPRTIAADASSHLHLLGSYHIARSAVRSGCDDRVSRVQAAWRGAVVAMSVGLAKEVADGSRTGFSATDLGIDALGAGYAVAQAYLPVLDRITPVFSVAPRAIFRRRGPRGALMDYSRQSLWLSANVHDLLPRRAAKAWPAPVRLSVGRRAFGGPVPSEYMVGLDLDAERLPGQHPAWVQAKRLLHTLRLPGPAFVMSPNGARLVGLYW